jgi:hypothetical protein
MAAPDISVIIVSWNVRQRLLRCLHSLAATVGPTLETLLVDNASTDGTLPAVAAAFPAVRVITSPGNLGFPKANNLALPYTAGQHILFLNPDTEVTPDALAAMLTVLETQPDVGIVGPCLVLPDGTVQLDGGRRFPSLLNAALDLFWLSKLLPRHPFFGRGKLGDWDHRDARDVPCIAGACMMVRRAALERVGFYLDERVPMYYEDLDVCWRVRRIGYRIHYLGTCEVTHYQGESSRLSPNPALLDMLDVGSTYLFLREHGGAGPALAFRALLLIASALRWLVYGGLLWLTGRAPGRREDALRRDMVRAAAWWRFARGEYRRAEAGTLHF